MVVGLGFKWSFRVADKHFVDSKIDLTFFNLVKAKFVAEPGTLIFISAHTENIEELVPVYFTAETESGFDILMGHNWDNRIAYFAIDNIRTSKAMFLYVSPAYSREEDLNTGQLKSFRLNPLPDSGPIDMDQLRAELKVLAEMLRGKSEAS